MKINLLKVFSLLVMTLFGNSLKAQQSNAPDSLVRQEPLQIWSETDGKDSIQSSSFRRKHGIIRSEVINGQVVIYSEDLPQVAPDRKPILNSSPKKD